MHNGGNQMTSLNTKTAANEEFFLFRLLETFVVLRYSSQHGEWSKN